ncbi:MAG: adenylate kinase [Limnochordia bacterium]|jgi:adenylate kinase|nr:adenylate kinase [Limnochordia bacterium]
MRLVLLGLPGAGKGTQGDRISEKYGIPHISTGSIIREAIAAGADLGQEANGYISRGELVPDELALQVVYERIVKPDCSRGWILDGFPRTVLQARELDRRLAENGLDVQSAFDIRVTQEEAIERIAKRRMCSQCGAVYHLEHYRAKGKGICDSCGGELYRRSDDTEETARRRLGVYMRQTHPVLHYYAQDGRLLSINGVRPIDQVFADVDHYLQILAGDQAMGEAR